MSKPKIYELWYGDYDGNSSWQFTHPNNKLRAEFKQDCQDVLREFTPDFIIKSDCFIGTRDLLNMIADNLKSRGYIKLEDTFENIGLGMGGSSIIQKRKYSNDDAILNLLGDELSQLIFDKNDNIRIKHNC